MSCPAFERIAAAASGEDDAILAHLDECADCQALAAEQSSVRLLVANVPPPPLARAHRELLAAEVMAQADWLPEQPRRRWLPFAAAGLAAAAGIALLVGMLGSANTPANRVARAPVPEPSHAAPAIPDAGIVDPMSTPDRRAGDVVVAPVPKRAAPQSPHRAGERAGDRSASLAGTADYARTIRGEREVVTLAGGELVVDARETKPVHVVSGDTAIAVTRAKVKVLASNGVISQVSVFAGTAQVTQNGSTHVIEAGMVWERLATPADSPTASSAAFQEGWAALREGRNADAISAFDRAVDPIVAEDALYWAAIASERVGDAAGATQRYEALVERFPTSPRAKKAKKALGRLAEE